MSRWRADDGMGKAGVRRMNGQGQTMSRGLLKE